MKKASVLITMVFFCAGILSSQSLVELSKKEKERRAKLKGKKIIVLTAAAAKNNRRRSAIIITETPNSRVEAIPADLDEEKSSTTSKKLFRKPGNGILIRTRKKQKNHSSLKTNGKRQRNTFSC